MTARLLIGPAGSGKTESCIRELRRLQSGDNVRPAWALLPDRAQVVEFRRRMARAGGAVGARIETMDAMVEEILMRADRARPRAYQLVQRRLISRFLRESSESGSLRHFAPIADAVGLTRDMQSRIDELERAGVEPDAFAEYAFALGQPKTADIAAAFSAYEEDLDRLGWGDPGGLIREAAALLDAEPGLLAGVGLVVVDGFNGLQRPQLALLAAIARACDLMVTSTGEVGSDRRALARFTAQRDALLQAIPGASVETLEPRGGGPAALRTLERCLFEPGAVGQPGESVTMLRTRTQQEEVREGLRWIKARIVRDGLPPSECALLLTDMERDGRVAEEVAAEFGVPIRIRYGRRLQRAPAVVALLDLLDLPRLDWPRRLTLESIRTPYVALEDLGLSAADAVPLESVSYWGQVVAGLSQWEDALERLLGRPASSDPDELPAGSAQLPSRSGAGRMLEGLRAFADRLSPPDVGSTHDWVVWLEDLLEDLHYFDSAQSEEEGAVLQRLRETLRALVLAEAAVGESQWSYAEFIAQLGLAVESARYHPRQDWRRSAVQVMPAESVGGLRFQAVAVVGLSEGQLPRVERADAFLDEGVRQTWGLEPQLGRQQESTFYTAVTRADSTLLLTRCILAPDGETWQPSPYWNAALDAFGLQDDQIETVRSGQPRALCDAGSLQEFSFSVVRRGEYPAAYKPLSDRLQPIDRARTVLAARSSPTASGPFEGQLPHDSPPVDTLFSRDRIWSPSRVEGYTTCPHVFFVGQLLLVDSPQPPELGPDARQLGSLLHEVLEEGYRSADDSTDVAGVLARIGELADQALESAPDVYGFRPSPLWHIEQEQLQAALERTVEELAKEGDGWRPSEFERRFGLNGEPPLVVDTDAGRLMFRGIIDRLDVRGDEVRVIDYKTSQAHIAKGDLISGRRLQLPLYAMAAERALGLGRVTDGFYWAIIAAKRGTLRLATFRTADGGHDGVRAAYGSLESHLARFIRRASAGEFFPEPPAGGCPSYCPAAGWCWRYSPGYHA
jgi:ATP-dependent helicase/nuclease subunit B